MMEVASAKSLWGTVAEALKISGAMTIWGLVVSLCVLTPYLARLSAPVGLAHVKVERNDTLLVEAAFCSMQGHLLDRLWCFDYRAMNFSSNLPTCLSMFGMAFVFVLRLPFLQKTGLAVLSIVAYVVQVGLCENNEDGAIRAIHLNTFVGFSLIAPVYLKLVRPSDCQIWKTAVGSTFAALFGTTLAAMFDKIANYRLLFSIILLPVIRELILTPSRFWSKLLTMDNEIQGKDQILRREAAWSFMLFAQVFCTTWVRMIVSSFADSKDLALYLVSSSVLEFATRVSIARRDRILAGLVFNRLIRTSTVRSSVVVAPISQEKVEVKSSEWKVLDAEWTSLVILLEMLAEYIGIFFNLLLIIAFRNDKLAMPVQFFAEENDLFNPSPLNGILWNSLSQVFMELLVDTAALVFEIYALNLPVSSTWKAISFKKWTLGVLLAALVGVANAVSVMRLSLYDCKTSSTMDICQCAVLEGSLYHSYCKQQDLID